VTYVETIEDKLKLVESSFSHLIGKELSGYEIAKVEIEGVWSYWNDLPIYLAFGEDVLSISWTQLNELAISQCRTLPFNVSGFTLEWVDDGFDPLDKTVGKKILSVSLGRSEFSLEDNGIEIWTRLFIGLNNGKTLEIFNALDENGYCLHEKEICGEQKAFTE
jgi:hypothetical protein